MSACYLHPDIKGADIVLQMALEDLTKGADHSTDDESNTKNDEKASLSPKLSKVVGNKANEEDYTSDQAKSSTSDAEDESTIDEGDTMKQPQGQVSRRTRGQIPPAAELDIDNERARRFQSQLIHVLRQRISQAIIDETFLRDHLRSDAWNLDLAETSVRDELAVAQVRHNFGLEGRDESRQNSDFVLGAGTLHESHRRAIDLVYRRINLGRSGDARYVVTALEISLLLNATGWNVERALSEYIDRQHNPTAQVAAATEMRQLRIATTTQYNIDRRLAMFMMIAGVDDAISAQHLLQHYQNDLGLTIDEWMRSGMPTIQPTNADRKKATYHQPTLRHQENTNHWPADRPIALPMNDITPAEEAEVERQYGTQGSNNGFTIRYDLVPGRRFMANPNKTKVESIINGTYKQVHFTSVTIPGTGKAARGGKEKDRKKEPLDWNNDEHVTELNKWYTQHRRRIAKAIQRQQPATYLPAEREWLYSYYRKLYDDVLAANQEYRKQGGPSPIQFDKKKLEIEFNSAFEGKEIAGSKGVPRPKRKFASLSIYSGRQKDWCEEFGFRYNPAHKPRKGQAARTNRKQRTAARSPINTPEAGDDDHNEGEQPAVPGSERKGIQQGRSTTQSPRPDQDQHSDEVDLMDDDELEALRQIDPIEHERITQIRRERENRRNQNLAARLATGLANVEQETSETTSQSSLEVFRGLRRKRESSPDEGSDNEPSTKKSKRGGN